MKPYGYVQNYESWATTETKWTDDVMASDRSATVEELTEHYTWYVVFYTIFTIN